MSIELDNVAEVNKHFQRAGEEIEDFTEAMREIGSDLMTLFGEDVFATEGQIIDEAWEGLSEPYKWFKQVKFPGAGILVASGAMQRAFKYKYNATSVVVSNPTKYLKYHQEGTSKMPARMVVKVTQQQQEEIVEIIQEDLRSRLRRIFG